MHLNKELYSFSGFFWNSGHALFQFFTIYLNISHIQNRYNFLFFWEMMIAFLPIVEDEKWDFKKHKPLMLKKRMKMRGRGEEWSTCLVWGWDGTARPCFERDSKETIQLNTEKWLIFFFNDLAPLKFKYCKHALNTEISTFLLWVGLKAPQSDHVYHQDVDHTQLEVYEVVQTFGSCGFKLPRWKIFKGHQVLQTFRIFLFGFWFCFLFTHKGWHFPQQGVKILKDFRFLWEAVLNCICTTFE